MQYGRLSQRQLGFLSSVYVSCRTYCGRSVFTRPTVIDRRRHTDWQTPSGGPVTWPLSKQQL